MPDDFTCPLCGAAKTVFKDTSDTAQTTTPTKGLNYNQVENLKELTPGEISAICSNLAKGCEKQRLMEEMDAFNKIAVYYKSRAVAEKGETLDTIARMCNDDLTDGLTNANSTAKANADRGAMRSLVWCEKVSLVMKTLLDRFSKEGDEMLRNTKIWVCDICGFLYIGDISPEICPVCKVPNYKIIEVERR